MDWILKPIQKLSSSKKWAQRFFLATALLTILLISYFKIFDLCELQTYDWRSKLRGPRPVSADIVLIDIWDDTLAEFGWPFDRKYYAELIEALHRAGAKAVMFDILFVEPKDSDTLVAAAAKKADNVYFANAFDTLKATHGHVTSGKILEELLTSYSRSAKAVGFVNVQADIDGKRRRAPLVINCNGRDYFHFTLQALADIFGIPKNSLQFHPGSSIQLLRALQLPLDEDGYFIISFAGKWVETFQHYSFKDVVRSYEAISQGKPPVLDLNIFKNKICIIGHTATATHDANANPLEPIYPNVGIHANIMNNVLERDFIRRAGRLWNLLILAILCGWIAWVSSNKKPLLALFYAILTVVLFIATACFVFLRFGIWVDLFYPVTVSVIFYTALTFTRVILEMRKREVIENELKIASQIQKSFLPETLPEEPGISLAVYMKPAKAVGGDLYTFVLLGNRRLGVMAGDVSGKGTPAALFMAKAVSEFKFSAREKTDPSAVLFSLNNSIASESTGGLFVTLVYAIFDIANRRLVLSNGGHLPAVLVRQEGTSQLLNVEDGMPIGVMGGISFSNFEMDLKNGDCLAFYSDGVSEARNIKKEEFGVEALQQIMAENRTTTSQEILDKAVSKLNFFMGKAEQHDDITLIIVKIEGLA